MLNMLLALLLFGAAQEDVVKVFKKEMAPLQSAVDGLVSSSGAQVMQRSHAAYIEGYGIIVSLELVFERPQGIFDTPKAPAEIRSLIAQRRKDIQDKVTAFVKNRVATMDSLGATDSLTIVLHIMNTNPTDVPNLPVQIQITARKDSPQQAAFREF
jgi:hypothetical protein